MERNKFTHINNGMRTASLNPKPSTRALIDAVMETECICTGWKPESNCPAHENSVAATMRLYEKFVHLQNLACSPSHSEDNCAATCSLAPTETSSNLSAVPRETSQDNNLSIVWPSVDGRGGACNASVRGVWDENLWSCGRSERGPGGRDSQSSDIRWTPPDASETPTVRATSPLASYYSSGNNHADRQSDYGGQNDGRSTTAKYPSSKWDKKPDHDSQTTRAPTINPMQSPFRDSGRLCSWEMPGPFVRQYGHGPCIAPEYVKSIHSPKNNTASISVDTDIPQQYFCASGRAINGHSFPDPTQRPVNNAPNTPHDTSPPRLTVDHLLCELQDREQKIYNLTAELYSERLRNDFLRTKVSQYRRRYDFKGTDHIPVPPYQAPSVPHPALSEQTADFASSRIYDGQSHAAQGHVWVFPNRAGEDVVNLLKHDRRNSCFCSTIRHIPTETKFVVTDRHATFQDVVDAWCTENECNPKNYELLRDGQALSSHAMIDEVFAKHNLADLEIRKLDKQSARAKELLMPEW